MKMEEPTKVEECKVEVWGETFWVSTDLLDDLPMITGLVKLAASHVPEDYKIVRFLRLEVPGTIMRMEGDPENAELAMVSFKVVKRAKESDGPEARM